MKINNDNLQKSIHMEVIGEESEYDKKKKEIIKMLGDNPIAKKLEEKEETMDKMDERYDEWEEVQCVINGARELYMDKGNLKEVAKNLIDALTKISK
jgi:hypothetical protein